MPLDGVFSGTFQSQTRQFIQRYLLIPNRVRQDTAQRQRVGASLDEAGSMRGVLHGVGEDEGVFFEVVQARRSEQRGDGNGQHCGDSGAHEPDGIGGLTGGTPLQLRVLRRVRSIVRQDRLHPAVPEVFIVFKVGPLIGEGALAHVQPRDLWGLVASSVRF